MANRPDQRTNRAPRPLDAGALDRLALHYVARYATTRAKLVDYLRRKLRERGWEDEAPADPDKVADRMVEFRYIDDAAFAQGRADALQRRGYGERRIEADLRASGVANEERSRDPEAEWEAAIAFARRRRIGPFANGLSDRDQARRAIGAMLRAGHGMETARRIVSAKPGEVPDAPN